MLPEHIKQSVASTATTDVAPTSPELANNIDNIITISTASINECTTHNSSADIVAEKIKSHKIYHQTSQKIVQFLGKGNNSTTPDTNTLPKETQPANTNKTTTTAKSHNSCCNISRWISLQENIDDVHHRKGRRLHGLQLPLHPLQLFGWLVLILFGLATYYLLIPAFNCEVQGPLYGLISGLFIVHVASHLAALLIDPADRELRRVHRNDRIVPEFDRSRHTHVIENGRCHLCNIRCSSQRSKHCSVCNKCVGKFDHHCKWLNHCIGSRNYVAFLMCVVSAVIATLVIVAAVIAQIVFYYVQPQWLSTWYQNATASSHDTSLLPSISFATNYSNTSYYAATEQTLPNNTLALNVTTNSTTQYLDYEDMDYTTLSNNMSNLTSLLVNQANDSLNASSFEQAGVKTTAQLAVNTSTETSIAGIGVSNTIFLILLGILGLLAAITAGLLLHLCFFHIYISFLGLTTYEYIRNHRQAQEAKSKQLLSTLPMHNGPGPSDANNPSKKTNNCGQIYFCSSLRHPNTIDTSDLRYFDTRKPVLSRDDDRPTKLHCCANSREYHQTALKTFYMCSLLEEGTETPPPLSIAHISGRGESQPSEMERVKTFHCCSTFAATTTQRKVSSATNKATLVTNLESGDIAAAASLSARRSYLQFTEQCTFCTFRMRSPALDKRALGSTTSSTRSSCSRADCKERKPSSANSNSTSSDHQRCCMKAISKHQRWRRKWNCCSNVPDSPDVPNDIIATLALRHQHDAKTLNVSEIPVTFVKSVSGDVASSLNDSSPRPTSPHSANMKAPANVRNTSTWPVARLRHMLRTLSRYRRPRCRHQNAIGASAAAGAGDQVKQNQVRPLQLHSQSNGCTHYQQAHNCYDSSSPQPPSSTTTTTSEHSSEPSIYSDSSQLNTPNAIETILPTSVIRDDTAMTYTMTLPPALPPPTRRKIANPTDLDELAETLGFASSSSSTASTGVQTGLSQFSHAQRLPALNHVYRRQRRKHFLRTRSPTLSPIHESGLSNPTSPQLCRHNAATLGSAAVINLCGSTELVRKTSSNSSLHSLSSNSSST